MYPNPFLAAMTGGVSLLKVCIVERGRSLVPTELSGIDDKAYILSPELA